MISGTWENMLGAIDVFTAYYTGSYFITGIVVTIFFFLLLLVNGLELKYSIMFVMPLFITFVGIGWLVQVEWMKPVMLVIIGLFYAWIIIRMVER